MSWKDYLNNEMIPQKQDELSQATAVSTGSASAVTGMNTSIAHWQHWRDIYQGIQGECQSNLNVPLVIKRNVFENSWPAWQASHSYSGGTLVRPTVPNGYLYQASVLVPAWAPSTFYAIGSIVDGSGYYHRQQTGGTSTGTEPTWNTAVGGITYEYGDLFILAWLNIGAAPPVRTSGVTEPVWPTVLGSTVVDNDFLWTCVHGYIINYGVGYGTTNLTAWSIKDPSDADVYVYLGIGWDSNIVITKAITDWNTMYTLLTDSINGASIVLVNLNLALTEANTWVSSANTWKLQMTNRNSVLDDYKV